MTTNELMTEVFNKLDHDGCLRWPNWFCNEAALDEFVREALGTGAYLKKDAGYADGGFIEVAGSSQRFRLIVFVQPVERGAWQATQRLLIPEEGQEAGFEIVPGQPPKAPQTLAGIF
jgi:hypothetical protein